MKDFSVEYYRSYLEALMIKNVVFDFGGVLIDWEIRHLYRSIFADPNEMEIFLSEAFTFEANHRLDAGEPFQDVIGELQTKFPHYHEPLEAILTRWPETLGGAIEGTVDILERLYQQGTPLYGLTNWSAETFKYAEEFPFMQRFKGITVSGQVKLAKPDPQIYHRLLSDFSLKAQECLFIDDRSDNVMIAKDLGFHAVQFINPVLLDKSLNELGVYK